MVYQGVILRILCHRAFVFELGIVFCTYVIAKFKVLTTRKLS